MYMYIYVYVYVYIYIHIYTFTYCHRVAFSFPPSPTSSFYLGSQAVLKAASNAGLDLSPAAHKMLEGGLGKLAAHGFANYAVQVSLYKILFCIWDFVQESILFFVYTSFVYPPPSSRTLLRNIMFPPDPPLLQYTPFNIGDGNIL